MTTQQIADRWVELVRAEKDEQAIKELYSGDIISIENNSNGEYMQYEGLDGKEEKNKMWYDMLSEVHDFSCSDPVVADRGFAVSMNMDVTFKDPKWGRTVMNELAVFEIKDGKVIREEYIY